ncbi:cytochrome P450 monooxygenase pc-3 [Armillaria novae-zelandiae]|uniref:Cytochrome P450 monooxygenase pc-3 n=1 Tax=Armillaria novae-zelandiae TaxID=153914 RepID=A0AA39TQA9_9AGAR|nr:cytochrome P450 monooxygenase pc-3 [Armillaria novae-zelandiae]
MPFIFLSPGLAYLSRVTLTLIILPLVALWTLQRALAKSGFDLLPTWFFLAGPAVVQFIVRPAHTWSMGFTIRRDANRMGALLLPNVQENSASIVARVLDGFKNGYPDEAFHTWSEQYGQTFSYGSLSDRRAFTTEPEHVKAILATQFQDFEKGPFVFAAIKALAGVGVFNSDGERWKFHRTTTRPFFNKARISDFDNFERHAVSTISQIKARLREGYPVDFQDVVGRFTMDSATEYLFGKDVNSIAAGLPYPAGSPLAGSLHFINHPSNSFVKAFVKAQEQIVIRTQRGPSWPLSELWEDEVQPHREVINDFVQPMLSEALDRKAKGGKPAGSDKDLESMSLLDRLVQDIDDPKVIQDELINILIAGRDTTSSLLTFAVYMMCEHPDMVARLRSEILEKVGTGRPTYDDIREMKYLRAFLNETLRLYPTVPENARWGVLFRFSASLMPSFSISSSRVATTLPNKGRTPYYIPRNTRVVYSVFLMHRRTDLWGPDALEFDPDRFLDSRVHKYLTPNPFIFAPFNAGPRICLGQQFAYNEASYYLVRLLQTFASFSLAGDAQPPEGVPPKSWTRTPGTTKGREKIMLGIHVTMYAKAGLWVRMEEAREEASTL